MLCLNWMTIALIQYHMTIARYFTLTTSAASFEPSACLVPSADSFAVPVLLVSYSELEFLRHQCSMLNSSHDCTPYTPTVLFSYNCKLKNLTTDWVIAALVGQSLGLSFGSGTIMVLPLCLRLVLPG